MDTYPFVLLSFGVLIDAGKLQIAHFLRSFFFNLISFFHQDFININKNTRHLFLSFFLSFFLLSSQVGLLLQLLTCLLSSLFSIDVASYKSHDSFFLTLIFSFFKVCNKNVRDPTFLSFFLSFLSIMYTHTQIYTQNTTLVFYII